MSEILRSVLAERTVPRPAAAVALVLTLIAAVLMTVGWRLAARRRYEAHRRVQTAAVALDAGAVAFWMIRSLVLNVLPQIPARLGQRAYAVATLHAVVGAVAIAFGVFVVLRGYELVPQPLRFSRYRPYMRAAYALLLLGTLTGVTLYVVAYGLHVG